MEKKKSVYTLRSLRYGMTNGFSTLLTTVASTYWSLFLVEAVGMETAIMAWILSVGSIVDMISVPIVGVVMQKVNFKKGGKVRPWLFFGGIVAALGRWLSFTDLGLTGIGSAIWFGGTYIITYVAFNLAYSAFTALLPMMAKDPDDRVSFSSSRTLCNSIGKFLFSLTSVGLIDLFSRGNLATGYSMFALLIAVLVAFGFIQLFFASKSVDVIEPAASSESGKGKKNQYDASIWEMVKHTISKPFLLYLLGTSCKGTAFTIVTGLAGYYYTYVIGDRSMLTWYLTATTFMMMGGSFITPFISRLMKGARNTFILGIAIYGGCMGLAFFFGRSAISFTAFMSVAYVGYSLAHATEVAMYTGVVDYTQWKSGKDLKPFMMSLFSLTPKIGTTIGSALMGFGLVAVNFVVDNVTPDAANGVKLLISGMPAIIVALGVVTLLFFPLTDARVREMQKEIDQHRPAQKATDPSA